MSIVPQSRRASLILSIAGQALIYVVLLFGALLTVTPFLFLVSSSLKIDSEILAYPPTLLPTVWDFANYVETWQAKGFAHYFLNSTFIAVAETFLVLVTSSLAAYAFARMEFPGRNVLFILFLTTLMIPYQVILIPLYVMIKRAPLAGGNDILGEGGTGLINTYAGIILPGLVSVTGIFLLRQFMVTLPRDLDDAARIDGCGELGIFYRITLPLVRPALAAVGLFTFQTSWNNFLWPLLIGQKRELWTVQVALAQFRVNVEAGIIRWPQLLAGTVIATMPILLIFVFAQKYFIRGIALTGIK